MMESERGDTGGRTRTVFVETGLETATFAQALALNEAPTPDIGVPARTAGGGYAYAAWLARAERLAGTCDRPGSAWLKSAILRALPAGSQTERKAIRWAQQDSGAGLGCYIATGNSPGKPGQGTPAREQPGEFSGEAWPENPGQRTPQGILQGRLPRESRSEIRVRGSRSGVAGQG